MNHTTVKVEVSNGRPVIFKARTSGFLGISFNHHIWVCDGFRTTYHTNQYYMNWGWSGGGNGLYNINHWQANGTDNNYNKGRKMIIVH
ncbi:C10 family peptidase [Litoribacter ruber]|uniref:C10 family peptidase n=1 Tax=Litoribacter ruber TaxID=702568 RepID=UPI001BDB10F6|nr:C10 family peptidase [Litoribacter ruber]